MSTKKSPTMMNQSFYLSLAGFTDKIEDQNNNNVTPEAADYSKKSQQMHKLSASQTPGRWPNEDLSSMHIIATDSRRKHLVIAKSKAASPTAVVRLTTYL